MEIKRTLLKSLVACLVLSVSAVASADAMAHIEGAAIMDPGETKTFKVVLDSTADPDTGAMYSITVYNIDAQLDDGSGTTGVIFDDEVSIQADMDALKTTPEYIFFGDTWGPAAGVTGGGGKLVIGDNTDSIGTGYLPLGTLAYFTVTADPDPLVSAGFHQVVNNSSSVAGPFFEPEYPMSFPAWVFLVTPEPATLSLLVLGGLGMMIRRRRR